MSEFAEFDPEGPRGERLRTATGLVLRPAEERDLDALSALRAAREGEDPARSRDVLARAMRATGRGNALLLVGERGGEILGYGRVDHWTPPPGAPANAAPTGWYLTGVVVAPGHRRRGVGAALTRARLDWIAERAPCAWYFASARNLVTLALHANFGFTEVTRDVWFPGVSFTGGVGILFRAGLGEGNGAPPPEGPGAVR